MQISNWGLRGGILYSFWPVKAIKFLTILWVVVFSYCDGVDDFLCPDEGVEGREPLKASSHHSDRAEGGLGEGSRAVDSSACNHSHKHCHPITWRTATCFTRWIMTVLTATSPRLASADTQCTLGTIWWTNQPADFAILHNSQKFRTHVL